MQMINLTYIEYQKRLNASRDIRIQIFNNKRLKPDIRKIKIIEAELCNFLGTNYQAGKVKNYLRELMNSIENKCKDNEYEND
ncbi:hypothetical protein [Escherichia coli]|uniref:hypothetical protein n=1 Tax=Escherichia coli TaxID=562 RepID=UPI0021D2FB96|nr:hypothetical protein [Escherichia coli]MCU6294269.1 hypothetical protein [Escherichia coli]